MKITKLSATNVHGYLPINADFFGDLTFLTGLNGSGKTSALRLLMALLTPNLNELGSITFSEAAVTVSDNGQNIVVKAMKTPKGIQLQTTATDGILKISSSELEMLMEAKRREEPHSPMQDRYLSDPVYKSIRSMMTPMFLGLDRRFFAGGICLHIYPLIPILREVEYLLSTSQSYLSILTGKKNS